jgi:hypothetical protein
MEPEFSLPCSQEVCVTYARSYGDGVQPPPNPEVGYHPLSVGRRLLHPQSEDALGNIDKGPT